METLLWISNGRYGVDLSGFTKQMVVNTPGPDIYDSMTIYLVVMITDILALPMFLQGDDRLSVFVRPSTVVCEITGWNGAHRKSQLSTDLKNGVRYVIAIRSTASELSVYCQSDSIRSSYVPGSKPAAVTPLYQTGGTGGYVLHQLEMEAAEPVFLLV
jgi:hypothetical protein